jgi:BirA family transcriptional regulator, biotin operon repressor / biotin---[acetyl-CoA-carboxylase] ligase
MASFSESELTSALADGEWHPGEELAAGAPLGEAGLAEYIRLLNQQGHRIEEREGAGGREYRLAVPSD